MSKKKKASAKQTKQNLQKPAAKPAAAPKKDSSENRLKKEAAAKEISVQAPKSDDVAPAHTETKIVKSDAGAKSKSDTSPKPEPKVSKSETGTARQTTAKIAPAQPKESVKEAAGKPADEKKKEEPSPSAKEQKAGKGVKKKNKSTPDSGAPEASESVPDESAPSVAKEAAAASAVEEAAKPTSEPAVEPAVEEAISPAVESIPTAPEISPSASVVSNVEPQDAGEKRKVAKTLIDEEVDFSPGAKEASTTPPGESPRNVAKTMLEVNIGGLKEAAAQATGIDSQSRAEAAKTKAELNREGLRNAVEASARAIEDEIAAAIRESEVAAESQITQSEQPGGAPPEESKPPVQSPRPADRKIAKTMLDFRADELFELANSETDTLVDEVQESEPTQHSAPEPPAPQQRKVAKTMLEVDVPDISAIAAAAQASAQESVAGVSIEAQSETSQPVLPSSPEEESAPADRSFSYDEVSMEDLSEFAQALKEDKPMAPPGSRAANLRKTMLGIRKHGLASSASMAGVSMTSESEQPDVAAEHAPVRVSRSLHPLDNFSFDEICPTDDETENQSAGDSQVDAQTDPQAESFALESQEPADSTEWRAVEDDQSGDEKRTGTVEMVQNQQDQPSEGDFQGTTTVWPNDQERQVEAKQGSLKPERFVPKTMLDMDFLKESLSASVSRAEEKLAESIAQKSLEPQKQTLTSDDYKVAASNCPFVWADGGMTKDRVRYCTQCSAQVYDFSGFDMAEAQALIFKRENREGAPLYKREDGKFMTSDCPIGLKKKKDKAMLVGGSILALALLVVMVVISLLTPQPPAAPTPSVDTGSDVQTPPSGSPGSPTGTTGPGTTTEVEAPGTFHYKKGKGTPKTPAATEPVVVPPTDTPVPGTTSGYDEGGQFWQYTDKSNN